MTLYTCFSGYGYSVRRCRHLVEWFYDKYLKDYEIEIEVFHRGLKREGVVGWCDIQDCDENPRSFLIEVQSRLNEKDYLTTLCHEMWHVYQFVKGDLKIKSSKTYYKGVSMEDIDYSEQPFELEAYQKENKLYQEYIISQSA